MTNIVYQNLYLKKNLFISMERKKELEDTMNDQNHILH
jgi:hypothetical protein